MLDALVDYARQSAINQEEVQIGKPEKK